MVKRDKKTSNRGSGGKGKTANKKPDSDNKSDQT
jgi:hypothetical protein